MIARRTYPATTFTDPRRTMAWIGFVVLLLSLLAPQLSIESAAAAQTLTSQQEGCDEGFILNERTGECEREPQRVAAQITTECPEGTVLDQATGGCVPVREPEPTIIDDIQIGPTSPPELDDIQAEPTSAPEPTMPTEVVAEPTAAPPPVGYVQAIKHACPESFAPDETTTITELQNTCLDPIEGVLFHVLTGDITHASLPTDGTGLAQLGSASVGEIALAEEIPAGYGDPVVRCIYFATDAGETSVLVGHSVHQPAPAGLATIDPAIPDQYVTMDITCDWYNMPLSPDGFTNPEDTTNTLVARAWACPDDLLHEQALGYYLAECQQSNAPVDFTLTNTNGVDTQATSGGDVEWNDVPLGPFTLQEAIPEGYAEPIVICSWTAFYQGAVYDGFAELVPSTDGLIERAITVPNTHYVCHYFNTSSVPPIDEITG